MKKKEKLSEFNSYLMKALEPQWKHPELKDEEVLLINVKDSEDWESKLPEFIKSVRRGKVAYTTGGKEIVEDMKPLFGILK